MAAACHGTILPAACQSSVLPPTGVQPPQSKHAFRTTRDMNLAAASEQIKRLDPGDDKARLEFCTQTILEVYQALAELKTVVDFNAGSSTSLSNDISQMASWQVDERENAKAIHEIKQAMEGVAGTIEALKHELAESKKHAQAIGMTLHETKSDTENFVRATVQEMMNHGQALAQVAGALQPTVQGQQDLMQRINDHERKLQESQVASAAAAIPVAQAQRRN